MANFSSILPGHIALAMSADTPVEAVQMLSLVARLEPTYSLDCTDVTWRATSLAVRHGLLMEWLSAEIVEEGGL